MDQKSVDSQIEQAVAAFALDHMRSYLARPTAELPADIAHFLEIFGPARAFDLVSAFIVGLVLDRARENARLQEQLDRIRADPEVQAQLAAIFGPADQAQPNPTVH
ncbi:hypothetical protein QTI17_01350 [Variovorax sp. J31P179]|uniref:hypothetical protein n=1 Tax=Variovorax sp. J31P179 TaxID=3053508 RepID=UPI002578487A|nr:hypothetical protein [Variovorax sp. J31P179]MDM0079227.1 hypothetical protein [Variovorax sp. J31P179]